MTGPAEISFTDENFQSQHAAKCDLLIKISASNFSYAVVDQIQDQVKILGSSGLDDGMTTVLDREFSENPVFNFNFRKVKLAIESSDFTFIPDEVFDEEKVEEYAAFTSSARIDKLLSTHIRQAGIRNLFSIEDGLKKVVSEKFSDASLFSQAEPLIETAIKIYFMPLAQQAFIQVNGSNFEVLVLEGKNVKFYNVFQGSTANEFNYFLLFAINQLELDSRNTPLFVSGEILNGDERHQRVQKYFSDVQFADSSKLLRLPEALRQDSHRFFSLLSLNTCA